MTEGKKPKFAVFTFIAAHQDFGLR